ncbi:SPOR domain-containing protein [Parasphingorhabdus sp. JC815]|uniref:SPOR domain-containing protein n=1 Tax=Parasphingorhabdus sp. JC815 TaxID=3232140 RepID=UPI00345A0DB0
MSNVNNDGLNLEDDNRLPWLESAENYDDDDGEYSPVRVAIFVGVGILLLAAIVGAIYWMQNRDAIGLSGDGTLIAAPEGDYKVQPSDPQARQFEGEGDASFAASQGQGTTGKLGTAPPEEAPMKNNAPATPSAPDSAMIQLGAFSSSGQADKAWPGFARRFADIDALPKKITQGTVEGSTIYRLNAVAPNLSAAQKICNSLKAAGESCIVVP